MRQLQSRRGKGGETSHVRLGSFNCKFWPPHQRYIFKSLSSRAVPRARVFSETDSDYVHEDAEYNAIGPVCWRSELEPLMLFLQHRAWWGGRCLCGLIIRTQWSCCHQPCHLQLKRHDCVLGAFSLLARSPPPPHLASLPLGRFALNRSNFPRAMKSRNSS